MRHHFSTSDLKCALCSIIKYNQTKSLEEPVLSTADSRDQRQTDRQVVRPGESLLLLLHVDVCRVSGEGRRTEGTNQPFWCGLKLMHTQENEGNSSGVTARLCLFGIR